MMAEMLTLKKFADECLTPMVLRQQGLSDTPENRKGLDAMVHAAMEADRVVHISRAEADDFLTVIRAIQEEDAATHFLNGWSADVLRDLEAKLK